MNNPDLLNPEQVNQLSVPALVAITAPMSNTAAEPVYFHCALATASFHRKDGKKLPFMNHFYKATFAEDIEYLTREIQQYGNTYLRFANQAEVEQAKLMEDPLGTIRETLKKELSLEDLEKLLEERRKTVAANGPTDESRIAGVDRGPNKIAQAQGVTNHASATGANTATLAAMLSKVKK